MRIRGITVTTHYPKSDPKCHGDYYSIDAIVYATDGKQQREFGFSYGDAYHDKGYERMEGVLDAIQKFFGPKVPVIRINAADIEDYE